MDKKQTQENRPLLDPVHFLQHIKETQSKRVFNATLFLVCQYLDDCQFEDEQLWDDLLGLLEGEKLPIEFEPHLRLIKN